MGIFKKRQRESPVVMWLSGADAKDILVPQGYTPLSKNQDVLRCAYKIADLVSNMTIMLMENGDYGDIRIKDSLAMKIDVTPNRFMTRKNFILRIVMDLILYGNAVAVPTIKDGLLDEITLLPADTLSFTKTMAGYSIRCGAATLQYDEVLHFVLNPDPDKPYMGLGYQPMIKETVFNLLQSNATKTGFLKSKWKPSMVISVNSDVMELTDTESRKKILGSYTDTTEAGEPWLIPAGQIDVKTIQPLTLADLAIQDGITLDMKSLATAIGIPPFMVGAAAFNKDEYNNFISTTIMSFGNIIQQEFTRKIIYSPKRYFKLNPKSLLQYNITEKVNFVKEMVGGGMMNRNEARGEFDYSPVDDEGMNTYTVLENYLEVKDLGKQKKLLQEGGEEKSE